MWGEVCTQQTVLPKQRVDRQEATKVIAKSDARSVPGAGLLDSIRQAETSRCPLEFNADDCMNQSREALLCSKHGDGTDPVL